jgi:hypothetical protein
MKATVSASLILCPGGSTPKFSQAEKNLPAKMALEKFSLGKIKYLNALLNSIKSHYAM